MGGAALLRVAGCGLLLWPLLALSEPDAATLLACMRANVPQTLQIREVELQSQRGDGGERHLRGRLYLSREQEQLRATLKILAPADLAGAAYLLRERAPADEMYMYLPALAKVRRLRGLAAEGRLWGSDLSYGDLKALSNRFDAAGATLERSTTIDGRAVQVLALTSGGAAGPPELMRLWVDAQSCLALRAEFYAGTVLLRRISADPQQLRQQDRYWYAGSVRIDDLAQGSHTTLKVLSVTLDRPLNQRYFDPATFHLGD